MKCFRTMLVKRNTHSTAHKYGLIGTLFDDTASIAEGIQCRMLYVTVILDGEPITKVIVGADFNKLCRYSIGWFTRKHEMSQAGLQTYGII
jgi:hypothetical protein